MSAPCLVLESIFHSKNGAEDKIKIAFLKNKFNNILYLRKVKSQLYSDEIN